MAAMSSETPVQRAIAALGGSTSRAAAALGIKAPSIHEWIEKGVVPWARAVEIERLTFGSVRAEELCPKYAPQITYLRGTKRRVKTA